MDEAWQTRTRATRRDSEWGIDMSRVYLPDPKSKTEPNAQNAVMKHIQIPAEDPQRLEEVGQEIKALRRIYHQNFFKYAESDDKLTVYLALRVDEGQIVIRRKSNLLFTEAARETFRNQHKKV